LWLSSTPATDRRRVVAVAPLGGEERRPFLDPVLLGGKDGASFAGGTGYRDASVATIW
jgi:hypothetical protein